MIPCTGAPGVNTSAAQLLELWDVFARDRAPHHQHHVVRVLVMEQRGDPRHERHGPPTGSTARRRRRPPGARSPRSAPASGEGTRVDDLHARVPQGAGDDLGPRSCPSRPGLATTTRIFLVDMRRRLSGSRDQLWRRVRSDIKLPMAIMISPRTIIAPASLPVLGRAPLSASAEGPRRAPLRRSRAARPLPRRPGRGRRLTTTVLHVRGGECEDVGEGRPRRRWRSGSPQGRCRCRSCRPSPSPSARWDRRWST